MQQALKEEPKMLDALKKAWLEEGIVLNRGATEQELSEFEGRFHVKLPATMRDYFVELNGMPEGYVDGLTRLWPLAEVRQLTEFMSPSNWPARTEQEVAYILGFNSPLGPDWHRLMEPPQRTQETISSVSAFFLLPDAESYFVFGDYNIGGSNWAIKLGNSLESGNGILIIYDYTNVYHRVADSFEDFIAQYLAESPEHLI